MIRRRNFLAAVAGGATTSLMLSGRLARLSQAAAPRIEKIAADEDIMSYVQRVSGSFDIAMYRRLLGAANEFKEGDAIVGVAAADEQTRELARQLLSHTLVRDIDRQPVYRDQLYALIAPAVPAAVGGRSDDRTFGQLKQFLLTKPEAAIQSMMGALSSDAIACVVKLMTNDELIALGGKIFNPLPGTQIGSKGYLGARIQPNSPTDNVEDIRWQVFSGWSYGVGDVLLGTNPVSSEPRSVAAIERALQDLISTFGLEAVLPHCVLSHIDVQAQAEHEEPGSTELWFQSIAGCDDANETFDISNDKMLRYADSRSGQFGMYFETGQGADFTNGHGHGFDMVIHESRKYGFARVLQNRVAAALERAGREQLPWVHVNDVAGFIGPEVFRTREQLVRCCLEDIVMGKLHGLCIGLDICATLHMDISLDDLDWCQEQIMPANPAYLMALPTKIDPMLGYLTTSYQDHVRLRERFQCRVNDRVWQFFQELQVIDQSGRPTKNFGDPLWVFLRYRRRKGDARSDEEILAEGRSQLQSVRERGVFVASGHGDRTWQLEPSLERDTRRICADAKQSIWAELTPTFIASIPNPLRVVTQSSDRSDYILHPQTGERLTEESRQELAELRQQHQGKHDVQIVVSDGLNADAIMDRGHLAPFLEQVRSALLEAGMRSSPDHVVVTHSRVRAGYRIGELLFGDLSGSRAILHVIGERPGTGHHTFSVYITGVPGTTWGQSGQVDHNMTRVVSGVAVTAHDPVSAAMDTVRLLTAMM